MRIAIVGPGRLGRSLDRLWRQCGHEVRMVGRGDPPSEADVAVLTVPDTAVAEVAALLPTGPIVLHCSGALEVDVLRPHRPAGSLHPLMTFPGPEVAIPELRGVPAAVAGDPEAVQVAESLARELGLEPFTVPGDRRLYHAAAVIAGNFATLLLGEAATVLQAAGVPAERCADILALLAVRSIENARHGVRAALTGPVARRDTATLDAHRAALDQHELHAVRELYDRMISSAARQLAHPRDAREDDR